jgi:hypothetical protein
VNLNWSYNLQVKQAYILRIKEHPTSEKLAARCAESCEKVNMPYVIWDCYDGTKPTIEEPEHLKGDSFMQMVKLTDHYLTRGNVACALSHISVWAECVKIDAPVVVLEHDAIMLKRYENHLAYNSISYLGGREQVALGWPVYSVPPHGSDGPNYHFICRAHAYAIDPAVAKNMLAHVLKFGIHTSLDVMLRADVFPIHQSGLYAYEAPGETTIINRPADNSGIDRTPHRNDNLKV